MIVGITGTMSAGKSTVTQIIKEAGYAVYDTDKMVHKYYDKEGSLYTHIIETFGASLLNAKKEIDRTKLASLIFNDESKLAQLEALVFPTVLEEMNEISGNRDALIFIEVPMLFEAEMHDFFDKIIVVDANLDSRIKRAQKKGLDLDDIQKRMTRQWSSEALRDCADYIIENNSSLKDLQEEVLDVLEIIKLERSRLWIQK